MKALLHKGTSTFFRNKKRSLALTRSSAFIGSVLRAPAGTRPFHSVIASATVLPCGRQPNCVFYKTAMQACVRDPLPCGSNPLCFYRGLTTLHFVSATSLKRHCIVASSFRGFRFGAAFSC